MLSGRWAAGAQVSVQPVPYAHYRVIDVIRPIVGREDAAERLEKAGSPKDLESGVWRLWAALSVHALGGDPATWEPLAAEARELGRSACAPFLGWIADWGEAVLLARGGRSPEAVQVAKAALSPLEAFGDRYAAARLMVDLIPFLQEQDVASSAADVVPRLEAMGASTSAAEALRFLR